jgi:hypothetical protein
MMPAKPSVVFNDSPVEIIITLVPIYQQKWTYMPQSQNPTFTGLLHSRRRSLCATSSQVQRSLSLVQGQLVNSPL